MVFWIHIIVLYEKQSKIKVITLWKTLPSHTWLWFGREQHEHSSEYILLCSIEESQSNPFGTTQGWVNNYVTLLSWFIRFNICLSLKVWKPCQCLLAALSWPVFLSSGSRIQALSPFFCLPCLFDLATLDKQLLGSFAVT